MGRFDQSGGGRAYAERIIRAMSLDEKVGQLFILFAYGQTAAGDDARNTALYGEPNASQIIRRYCPGGFILFSARDNIANPYQVAELSNGLQASALGAGAKIPLLVSIDQEHGLVNRIGPPATQFSPNMALGAGRSTDDARTAAAISGAELAAMGIHQNYAPDVDVNVNPDNPVIGVRSFSSDPELVSEMAAATVKGYQTDARLIATAKHFPGHGDTAIDSHTGLPLITHSIQDWERIDAPPFRAAISAGVASIMTAHIVVPSLDSSGEPATLAKRIVTGQLRDRLGFDGVIVTDGLEMAGVRGRHGDAEVVARALEAGVDQLLLPPAPREAYDAVIAALAVGRLSEQRIDESVKRILIMKYNQGVVRHPQVDVARVEGRVGTDAHLRIADQISDKTPTLLRNVGHRLPLTVEGKRVFVTGYGTATGQALADQLNQRGATATAMSTDTAPTADQQGEALATAKNHDVTVVLTSNVTAGSPQQHFVTELLATGAMVIVASVGNPYDIVQLGRAPTLIAIYSASLVSIRSLARVIAGEIAPAGRLPVDIATAADPDRALYPFGYGLTW